MLSKEIYIAKGNTVLKKVVGEQSALRNYTFSSVYKSFKDMYTIDKKEVNYSLARQLYLNSHENYKLGGGFCKPIINSIVSFMGIPSFTSEDEQAKEVIDEFLKDKEDTYINIQKNTLREGDCYVLIENETLNNLLYKDEFKINFKLLLPERVTPITNQYGDVEKYIIRTTIDYRDEENNRVYYKIIEVWTETQYNKTYEINDVPDYLKKELIPTIGENPYGFIPIVRFTNDKEQFRNTGTSELEPVEPFIRAYHEVMLDSLRSTKLNSSPKLKIKTNDLTQFLANNFSSTEIQEKTLNIGKKDVFLCGQDDDLAYETVGATNHNTLLEFLFMCIVDVSETPEFLFGTAIASSKASAQEQMTPVMKKVERKRSQVKEPYQLMARMVFAIWNKNNVTKQIADYKTKVVWEDVDSEDDNMKVNTINTLVTALMTGVEYKLMSYESAINYLAQYIHTMGTYEEEKEKILLQIQEMEEDVINDLRDQLTQLEAEKAENNMNDDENNNGDNMDDEENNNNGDDE